MGNSIMIDLDDPRTARIADVISNKTAKRILGLLAEKEMSESEIAGALKMPLNTIGYNIKKLEESGLIEKVKGFLWSVKGKRIHKYKIADKKIVISPKKITRGVIPAVLLSGIVALLIKGFIGTQKIDKSDSYSLETSAGVASDAILKSAESANSAAGVVGEAANNGIYQVLYNAPNSWAWFFLGALTGLLIFLIWNWRKHD